MNNNSPENILYGTGIFVVFGTLVSLFYFSFLMPLHVDEGSIWYHFTNKTWPNRFAPGIVLPHHTLTTYMAKWSLPAFGYNGIGLRFPVILFGMLSLWSIHFFVKKILISDSIAVISAVLLAISPVFVHYSQELRGYPSLVFFTICSYYCLFRLLQPKGKIIYWWLLFLSFVGCYLASFSALMFFGALLSAIWFLRVLSKIYPNLESIRLFKNISLTGLFTYSFFSALFFIWVVLDLDSKVFNQSYAFYTSSGANFIAIPDMFSTFFGYKYLDDPGSLLYSYPLIIWFFGLLYFSYGIYTLFKKESFLVPLFLVLLGATIAVYTLSGKFIPVRSAIYLLPFIVIFQAYGLKESISKLSIRWVPRDSQVRIMYYLISGYLLGCFVLLTIGKYRNLEADSGNPYELARNYLENNSGPNDLIISSLYDTVGGFYLGNIIREKNLNIYKNGKIENIYYLASKTGESKIKLDLVYPIRKKIEILSLDRFKPLVSFENKGFRSSEVHIFKNKVEMKPLIDLNEKKLSMIEYFGNKGTACKAQTYEQGIRIKCNGSKFTCYEQIFNFPNIEKNDLQFMLFHHVNDRGNMTTSFASLKSMNQSLFNRKLRKEGQQFDPIPDVYLLNNLINNIDNADFYKENVDEIDISIQKMGDGNNTLFCMTGKLLEGNSLISRIQAFNWKQETPEVKQ